MKPEHTVVVYVRRSWTQIYTNERLVNKKSRSIQKSHLGLAKTTDALNGRNQREKVRNVKKVAPSEMFLLELFFFFFIAEKKQFTSLKWSFKFNLL